ncbi:MAG TPA: PKD domain-containing protein, partial [Thermoplasmata archaeon]|nr:PKD domain-containing protein [Thermoplasmata archaeon]
MTTLLAASVLGALAPSAAAAPAAPYFGPNVQVDQGPGYQGGQPSLVVGSDGVQYLAYSGWGGPTTGTDVFFTKSTNGRTWSVPVRVNDDTGGAAQTEPVLTLDSSNNIYIAWTDGRGGNNDVYFSKSTTGGASFAPNVLVNSDVTTNAQTEPSIAVDPVDNHLIHAVWTDNRNAATTGPDIYYINSTNGGQSFTPPSVRLNTDPGAAEQGSPAIAVAPDRSVDVVWRDPSNSGKGPDIYLLKSVTRGASWGTRVIVNRDGGNAAQQEPAIAVNATGAIFVAFTDSQFASTAPDISATVSTDGGASFPVAVKVNDDTGAVQQAQPSLALVGNRVQIAWSDYRTGGAYPYAIYTSSSADGLSWSPNVRVNGDTGRNFEANPSVGLDAAGDVFVAWASWSVVSLFPFPILQQALLASTLDVVAPAANAGPATSVDQGAAATFDGSGSSDNLGIASSVWDFGDGSTATGSAATHSYADAGTYTATLTVWDYSGNMATATRAITVRDTAAPVPRGGGDRTVDEGQALFFDGSASGDNVGVTSYLWDFGDGATATTATANHVYAKPGSYTAKLTVTDAAGNTASSTFIVTVRSSVLLTYIEVLGAVVGLLAILAGLLTWMLLGMRKKEREPAGATSPMGNPTPPPPRDSDPLEMSLPPRS